MKIKLAVLIMLYALLTLSVNGQTSIAQTIKIGDRLPDFEFQNLLNGSDKTEKAAGLYKDGLLIINFWATWCVPCVREMPYLDSIQAQNKGKLHIVCVTVQTEWAVQNYLNANKGISHLEFSYSDKQLDKLFPHSGIPHNVWVDKNGYVKAITADDQITDQNISRFLRGQTNLYEKKDQSFDFEKPLVVSDTEFAFRSVFTKIKNEIGTGGIWLPNSNMQNTRFVGWNIPKTNFIWAAYMHTVFSEKFYNLIELHAKDTSSYYSPRHGNHAEWADSAKTNQFNKWQQKNLYCYELSFRSKVNLDSLYSIMAKEIDLLFNISAKIENRKTACWVITRLNSVPILSESKSSAASELHLHSSTLIAQNQTWNQIAAALNNMYDKEPPFVDQTGINFPVDINKDLGDISNGFTLDMLKSYFKSIGLNITLENVDYPHLIIYDHND